MARLVKEGLMDMKKHFLEMQFGCMYDPPLANSGKKNSLNITEEIGVLSHPDAANPLITLRPTRF
jgi:hypothetical protein